MKKFTVEHDNVKIHYDTDKEVKDYLENLGRKKVIVVEHKIVYQRTASSIKVDRL